MLPLSWTGLRLHDLERAELVYLGRPDNNTYTVWTVPLAAACAAMVRVMCAQPRMSVLRRRFGADLAGLLLYNFHDTSCEGDHEESMPNEVPLSESELLEIENGVAGVKSWEMRDGEEWIRENLIKLVSGVIYAWQLRHKDKS